MIILPTETALDWKRPPWVTLTLIALCFAIFFGYQSRDEQIYQRAMQTYIETDLIQLEAPALETHLIRQMVAGDNHAAREQLEFYNHALASGSPEDLAWLLLANAEFQQYLDRNRELIWTSEERRYWLEHRPIVDQLLNQVSSRAYGLIPANLSALTLGTYQFLHGSAGHLIGNMIFLFLLGFAVERALGAGRFLIAYLLCGAVSGLVFSAFNTGSAVPLVGASGAIAGLMGMYVAIYGLRRIRFLFYAGVWFTHFRAPALMILPLWLGKEIFDAFYNDGSGIAYLAHAGGLVAGAGLILIFGRSWFQVAETFHEEPAAEDEAFTREYARGMALIGSMEFDRARKQFEQLSEAYPDRAIVGDHLYRLAKLRPSSPEYQKIARQLIEKRLADKQTPAAIEIWKEALELGSQTADVPVDLHQRILFATLREGDLKTAEQAFTQLRNGAADALMIAESSRLLAEEFGKRNQDLKARQYRELAATSDGSALAHGI